MTRRRPKLALCPFCQGRPEFDTGLLDAQLPKGQEFIMCRMQSDDGLQEHAIAAWNTRASSWRGIDSAPRDGTWVLIATKSHSLGVVVAKFGSPRYPTWWNDDDNSYENATHWMPLPAPPKEVD